MNKLSKAVVTLAAAGLIIGGITVSGAFAGTTSGSSAQNVPDGKSRAVPAVVGPARVFAAVNSDGTLAHGKSVLSTARIGTGVYDVRFNKATIAACAWTGTVGFGGFSGSTGPAEITITGRAGTTNGLFVTTYNGAGVATDEPFSAIVICS